jgi:hypothetical protein
MIPLLGQILPFSDRGCVKTRLDFDFRVPARKESNTARSERSNFRASYRNRVFTQPRPGAVAHALRSGHRNRLKPPFKLRQRGVSTFSGWMPTRGGKDRARPRPSSSTSASAGSHHRRRPSVSDAGWARARGRQPARAQPPPGVRARPKVPRDACGAARCHRQSTLDPCHGPRHTQPRALEMTIRTTGSRAWSRSTTSRRTPRPRSRSSGGRSRTTKRPSSRRGTP